MITRKLAVSHALLILLLVSLVGCPGKPQVGLPVLTKTVFIDLQGNSKDNEQFKVILNNDKTGSITWLGTYGNNSAGHGQWAVELQNNDMMKINMNTNLGKLLIILYANKTASLTSNPKQFLGTWHQ